MIADDLVKTGEIKTGEIMNERNNGQTDISNHMVSLKISKNILKYHIFKITDIELPPYEKLGLSYSTVSLI